MQCLWKKPQWLSSAGMHQCTNMQIRSLSTESLYKQSMPCTLHDQKNVDTWILHPYVIAERLVPKRWALICCYNSLHYSGKTLYKILQPGYRDLLSFSHKRISEVRHGCWAARSHGS